MTSGTRFFGTDGIRDVAGRGRLTPEHVHRIGRALAQHARERADAQPVRILLARDPRPSGQDIVQALAGRMAAEGAEVVDAGVLPSPALAWLTAKEHFSLGCSVSASHNPPEYNGIKPFLADGRKLSIAEEEQVEARIQQLDEGADGGPPVKDAAAAARYAIAAAEALEELGDIGGMRLVVDLSAGAASTTAPMALEGLGVEVAYLHKAGDRPINEECGSENPEAWAEAVATGDVDGGLAFDGDADRVLVADEHGEILDGDDMLAVLATDAHARGGVPANAVVSTVMANLGLEEYLGGLDVTLERTKVGDRNVAERMRELGAVFGGEPAGHIVLPRADAGGTLVGDGLVAGVAVLQAARRLGRSLSELRTLRPRRPQTLINVRMAERKPLDDWPAFQSAWREEEEALAGEGRFVIRYSGTEPLLRIMAEGRDAARVQEAVERLAEVARET
ncbi:MAG: phosphoglucosamine mutase [Planctomycetota bacterium]|nr:phosphoglucosamine mutase [Planctomycetota bacterium]